ncbi:MAG TPA: hypothetical protein VI075_03745 [Methyloceanibacter sp.]|jgi:hypothetical protein
MPQVLLLFAAGAGLLLAGRRWYAQERRRIAAELRAAEEALARRDARPIQRLERDPVTGIYRPKRVH